MRERHLTAKNGLDIYALASPQLHSFCIQIFLKGGVLYEGEDENGITHFLEHMYFRSLKRLWGEDVYRRLDELGASLNGCTYKEFVCFVIKGHAKHFDECADIITKFLAPLTVTREDVEVERERVKQEIREEDTPSASAFHNETVWSGTPLARPILGEIATVNRFRVPQLEQAGRRLFSGGNVFLYVTGSFTEENLVRLAEEAGRYELGGAQTGLDNTAPLPACFGRRDAEVRVKACPGYTATLSFDFMRERPGVAELLYDVLFTGLNSRFYIGLSEDTGLIYDFDSRLEQYRNAGIFLVRFDINADKLLPAVEAAAEVFRSIKRGVGEQDLKNVLSGYVEEGDILLDDPEDLGWTFAYDSHIMGMGFRGIEERREVYTSVRAEEVRRLAQQTFRPENVAVTLLGNKRHIPLERIRSVLCNL